MSQICLCGKPVGGTFTKEGLCFHCSFCHYFCTEQDAFIYDQGVKKFLATKQDRPRCCMIEGLMRNYARMRVVTDMEKPNFGRPFFVCSKKHNPCNYFEWGDQQIIEKPLCKHGKPSGLFTVKKEGPNKDRMFFRCREKENMCKFFKWFYPPVQYTSLLQVYGERLTGKELDNEQVENNA